LLEISLLSPFTLTHDGQPLKLPSRRTEALVVYLLRNPHPHAREVLANLLWDDLPQNKALGNLRVLLANLRKALDPYVTITRQSAAWNGASDYRVDLTALEEMLALSRVEIDRDGALTQATAANLGAALQGYQGDLLPGFYLHAGQGFEEWLATEREWLWTRAVEALDDLATEYLQWGDYRAGVEQAQRLVDLDPLREEGHQLLMQLWAADGQISAALAQYERCVQVLDHELGVPPHGFTTELYERMRRGDWQPSRPMADPGVGAEASATKAPPHNLPRQMAPIWGRATELAQLATLLGDPTVPLITILGPGGIGKTRLALEAARTLITVPRLPAGENDERIHFQDGIYLVALAPIRDAAAIAPAIAAVIGCRFQPNGGDETTQLLRYLRSRSMLLLLDNAEHLLDETEIFGAILAAAPQVQLLVTSRHKLNRTGETVLLLTGLDYPPAMITRDPGDADSVSERLLHYSAVRLFVEHVRRAHGNLSLGDADLQAVGQICRLAQGMPLAILLAAAWVELLSPAEIAAEIEQNVAFWGLATDQAKTAVPEEALPSRQQTMHAIFEHSWQLLTRDEQGVFARLSIFRGGCTRPVAQQVTGGSLRELLSLAHKSLLVRDSASGRFTVHELLRQMAAEKLLAMGQAATPLHQLAVTTMERLYAQNLMPYYGELAEHAEQAQMADKAQMYLQLAGDVARDNYQNSLALDYYGRALALTPDAAVGTLFALQMARQAIYHLLGRRPEQAAALASLADLGRRLGDSRNSIEVLVAQARYLETVSDYAAAVATAQEAAQLAESVNAPELHGKSLLIWGQALWRLGDLDGAQDQLGRALAMVQIITDPLTESTILRSLGIVAEFQWKYAAADVYYERSLAICRREGNRQGEVGNLNNLGVVAFYQGDLGAAQRYLAEALPIRRLLGDRRGEGHGLHNLGVLSATLGDYARAQRDAEQSLIVFREVGDRWGEADALHNLGSLLVIQADYGQALALYQAALTLAQEIGYQRCTALALRSLGHLAQEQNQPDVAKAHYAASLAGARQNNFSGYALEALAGLAVVALDQDEPTQAQRLVSDVLAALDAEALAQANEPFRIYLTCYRILQTTGDHRATPLLVQAHQRLQQLAALITDESLRHSYLQTIPIHREIIAAFEQG